MRLKLICCKVMAREIGMLSAASPNYIDITFLRQGYHDTPEELKKILQAEINAVDGGNSPYTCLTKNGEFDAILLGYGLCCNGTAGISSKKYPIIIPKAHDCITMLLGSKEKYDAYFNEFPGTFWYTAGWCESIENKTDRRARLLAEYTEKYGEDNAEYLVNIECSWNKDYQNIIYVNWNEFPFPDYSHYTQTLAEEYNLHYHKLTGDCGLLKDFLNGNWDDRFLVIPPNHTMEPSYDSGVIKIKKECGNE